MKAKRKSIELASTVVGLICLARGTAIAQTPTVIPPDYAMPAGSVNTNSPGFLARPYQTDAPSAGNLAWTEDQLAGLHGPNTADLSGADPNGYFRVATVVNWGDTVDNFPTADAFPGGGTANFSEEVITYLEFPTAGTYKLGVNSDDGFGLAVSHLNPKDRFSAVLLGQFNATRGAGDTLFQVSVSQPGIYPFRLVYFQAGGGFNVAWFSVITNASSTNFVLINDLATSGALKAYSTASIAPPYISRFVHDPTGFTISIKDDISALAAGSVQVTLNGATATVTTNKTGRTTAVTYTAPSLLPAGVTNTIFIQFADDAQPAHTNSATFSYVEIPYTTIPPGSALPATAVDTTQRGFLYRIHQIDSGANGVLAANIAHAEAQLAGLLAPPGGQPYQNVAGAGTQPDGSFVVTDAINFSLDTTAPEGVFTNDVAFPGIVGTSADNVAVEIIAYLDLTAGFHKFAVNSADGFRVTVAANPYDTFGTELGIYDSRRISAETQFGVVAPTDGIYPIRLVFFRQSQMADNSGDAGLEFYTINSDGTSVLVNQPASGTSVKAYWKRTAGYGSFVKYAGPTAFVSPFTGPDVGFKTASIVISDGTSNTVDASSVALKIDGSSISATATSANGLTTLAYTPAGLQLPRTVHTAQLVYADAGAGGIRHTNTWSFNLLRNYLLPAPLYFEDFESTPAGPSPMVPAGWVAENHTGQQNAGFDTTDLNSDFYLGWVVVDKSFNISKDFGVSAFAVQELNGNAFNEDTNPLLVNHYIRSESDSRQNGPPGQIDYVTTTNYDLSGKTGIVIAFDSAYEQNQDAIVGIEYSVNGGANWNPVFYWLQEGYDSQGVPDIIRDGSGNIDVNKTMLTSYNDVARYTDTVTGELVGGYYGFFLKAPITPALAQYIEGRVNDDGTESKRIELYRVVGADNQKTVQFRFLHAGTSSWYWAIDNWGVYSVPSVVLPGGPGNLTASLQSGNIVLSWTGASNIQLQMTASLSSANWQIVSGTSGTSSYQISASGGGNAFYRLVQQ
ncbi:MAG: hypothetical protein E6L09_03470 [Verrucomicrobia bacterium]|nr:MAG: hypothetical protein E6L09_03470 [Verrucomicrobiota bacterium]